jgi:hypothetical protein
MDVCAATLDEMVLGGWWRGIEPKPRAPGQNVPSRNENNSDIASYLMSNDNDGIVTDEEIAKPAAERFGLDPQEAVLALRYAAAAKQGSLTAPPDEAKRLNNIARLWSLTLDLCQRLKVAVQLPPVLKTKQQRDFAGRLSGNFFELNKLEKILFGTPRTPKDPLVSEASGKARAYQRVNPRPKTPTPPRSDGGESPHLAA